ncbi:hypothetical protein C7401_13627 [Paraburkholderia unamae]|uniref:hypothetical protein n=1 Tax=Paraburkholderia unamae TaxID=219649 RepID=UPI000DC4675B|nr:hypothetical protein [Paraburkholderia unamae]RAR51667.1 hypothetical protein C7401_13627 [Paraburkholderia unamae]
MKLCINCRYYGGRKRRAPDQLVVPQPGESRLCLHPSTITEIDPEDGEPRRYSRNALAYNQRQYPHWFAVLAGRCGTRARFFEPMEGE